MLVLLAAALALPARSASPVARAARLAVSGETLEVNAASPAGEARLDCAKSAVQRTVRRCSVGAAAAPFASCLGRAVAAATLNLHFSGEVLNLSVEFAAGTSPEDLVAQLKAELGRDPTVQYWADDAHLYASSIWVDGETEVEVTRVVKGAGAGAARLYASSLLGGRPLAPEDAR